jgi:UDP-4-amino-4-deoxy-L-arabinose-oxoglutarate aminotransferase
VVHKPVEFYRHSLGEGEFESIRQTLGSVFLTLGPRVEEFERRFADMLCAPHAVGVSSCSMGLVLALRALDIGPGDEVITTPLTFVSTSNAILQVGAKVVFADVDVRTGLIDPDEVARLVGPRTRAIIPVHLYGQMADMPRLRAIADRHGLALVEDAAHALEARSGDIRPGTLGDAAVFSFYATKTLTCGDGGALVVRSEDLASRLRLLRNHGITKDAASRYGQAYRHWDMNELGYKAPLTDIQASILLPQLEHLEARRARREALVLRYEDRIRDVVELDTMHWQGVSSHHLFTVLTPTEVRDEVVARLCERGIGCAVNYRAVHVLRYYRERFGFAPEDLPVAWQIGERTLSLPLWPDLPSGDVDVVVEALVDSLHTALG